MWHKLVPPHRTFQVYSVYFLISHALYTQHLKHEPCCQCDYLILWSCGTPLRRRWVSRRGWVEGGLWRGGAPCWTPRWAPCWAPCRAPRWARCTTEKETLHTWKVRLILLNSLKALTKCVRVKNVSFPTWWSHWFQVLTFFWYIVCKYFSTPNVRYGATYTSTISESASLDGLYTLLPNTTHTRWHT